jgi:hypothetical protein
MSKLRVLLKCIKKSAIWKFLIEYFFYPSLHFLWSFVFNFKSKILYYLWSFKKKDCFNLNNNDKLLVRNNTDFTEIGNKILLESEKLIPEAKKKLFDTTYSQEKKKLNEAAGELPYSISLYENLSDNLKKEIVQFASQDKMITTANNHMKIFPILTRVQVILNIPREGGALRSAMFWHKDTFGFKNLDFFMTITDVDDDSGPFFCLEKKVKAGVLKSFDYLMKKTGERNKVNLENFDKKFEDFDQIKLTGKCGTGIFIDSFSTFHRGGFCKSKDRIMLRLCYQSQDALCDTFLTNKDHFIFDESITKNNTKNIFKNFLFFDKPSTFMKFFINKLHKFYRLIEFKY